MAGVHYHVIPSEAEESILNRFLRFAPVLSACPCVLRRKAGQRAKEEMGTPVGTTLYETVRCRNLEGVMAPKCLALPFMAGSLFFATCGQGSCSYLFCRFTAGSPFVIARPKGRPVEVVTEKALNPYIHEHVLREAVPL